MNDGSVAGMFLGLLIGLFVPNVLIMAGLSDDVIIFMSIITLIAGIVWTNDNLPAKNVNRDIDPGSAVWTVASDEHHVNDEEFMVGRKTNNWLGDAVERTADELQAPDYDREG